MPVFEFLLWNLYSNSFLQDNDLGHLAINFDKIDHIFSIIILFLKTSMLLNFI